MKKSNRNPLIIILNDIRSALNVGAILRTADAIGAEAVYSCGITATKDHPKIKKTALGAEETVPTFYKKSVKLLIKNLKKKNYQIIGLEIDKNAINFWEVDYEYPVALIVGNEVEGITKEILNMCDLVIKIPMYGQKESLNVATATGVAGYEIIKQTIYKK